MNRNWSWTLELSPPWSGAPQVTTVPSAKIAAKAPAERFWADLGLRSCHRRSLERPRSPHFRLLLSQQKQRMCHRPAERSWADLGFGSCHCQSVDCPTSVSYYRSKSSVCVTDLLNVPELTLDSEAVTAKVSIAPLPSPTIAAKAAYVSQTCWTFLSWPWIRKLSLPKCRLPHFHLLLSQQKQRMCRESAEPYWTDLGLWGCRPHSLERPITSITPQSKRFACCCYLWLLCNSSNGVSILKLRKSKRVCWI